MNISNSNHSMSFLSGGGEMGDLIRRKDWRKTPLGSPETWSQSLRTTLSIMLNSKFPMFIFWGPELTCFYNDAFRPSLGENGKHPSHLGFAAEEFWNEIWNEIKPIIDNILAGGEATLNENLLMPIHRNNSMEDVYWTFSHSPVRDEADRIAGVLVSCVETTNNVIALKKLIESQEKLEFAINATDLGTWDLNPITNKFIYNKNIREWFGLSHEYEIEAPLAISSIAERDRQRTIDAMAGAMAPDSDGNYEIQHAVINSIDGKERVILAKGKAIFNEDGIVYRFSGTAQDITKELSYRKIDEEKNLFNKVILESNPDCVKIIDKDGRISYMNENGVCVLEGDSKSYFIDRKWESMWGAKEEIIVQDAIKRAFAGEKINFQAPSITVKGNLKWWDVIISALPDENGVVKDLLAVSRDITGIKNAEKNLEESEEQLRFALEGGNLGYFDSYPQTGELNWSNKAKELFGLAPEAEVNLEIYKKLVHPDDYEHAQNVMIEALLNNKSNLYENEFRTAHEKTKWLKIIGKIKHDENGIPVRVTGVIQDITDKKLADIKISESEKNFRMLADQAPMWIWLMDYNVNVLYANTEVLKFVGINHYSDFTGRVWETIVHPDDIALVHKSYQDGASRLESFNFECRIKNAATGIYEWIFLNVVTRKDADNFIGFIGTAININQQKTQLLALKESEERFRMLAETLPALVWVTDAKGNTEYVSGKWKEYTGVERLTAEDWASITHPDDVEKINKIFSHNLVTGDTYKFDVRLKSKNQKYRWFTVNGVPLFDDNNNIVKWIGAFMDIQTEKIFSQELEKQVEERTSELKIVNEMLFQRNEMLSVSESFNRNLTEVSPNIVYILDLEKNTPIFLNQTGLKLIGHGGKKTQEFNQFNHENQSLVVHPDDLPGLLETIKKVKKSKKDEVFEHEYRIKNLQGNWTPILARDIVFKRNAKNEVTQLLGIGIDITEIKKSKNILEQKNQELEKMNKELEAFAYVSSHDLQEP